jgi:hypothetical protein
MIMKLLKGHLKLKVKMINLTKLQKGFSNQDQISKKTNSKIIIKISEN